MKHTCTMCGASDHLTPECPRLRHVAHGAPRVAADTSLLTRKVDDKPRPRRPMIPERSENMAAPPHDKKEETIRRQAAELEALHAEVATLKRQLALRNTVTPVASPVTPTGAKPVTGVAPVASPLRAKSNAERQAAYRRRLAARKIRLATTPNT